MVSGDSVTCISNGKSKLYLFSFICSIICEKVISSMLHRIYEADIRVQKLIFIDLLQLYSYYSFRKGTSITTYADGSRTLLTALHSSLM